MMNIKDISFKIIFQNRGITRYKETEKCRSIFFGHEKAITLDFVELELVQWDNSVQDFYLTSSTNLIQANSLVGYDIL